MVSSNQETEADSLDRYYLEEAEPAFDSKLLIKLKTPKSDEGIEEGETASSAVKKEHYCADCEKSFSSGKALGGHMSSAHVQAGRDYQSKKLRLKKSTTFKQHGSAHSADNGFGGDGAKKIVCRICGKDFPTRKSLYGHMRCHPDREYRGMQPPESKKSRQSSPSDHVYEPPLEEVEEDCPSSSSTPSFPSDNDDESVDNHPVSVDPPIDLTRFLSRWAVTGQRGRQANNPDKASSSDQSLSSLPSAEVEELSDAANSLVSLSNGTRPRHKEEDRFKEDEDMNNNSMTPNAEIVEVKSMRIDETKKQKTEVYPAKKAKDFPAKPVKLGERKPNCDAEYYEDVKRTFKSKRLSADQRQISPVKKLIIGERKPERQILQPAPYNEGKGKAPMEPKSEKFGDAIRESGDEDFRTGYGFYKSFADDSDDSEKTPEHQNQEYLEHRNKNGFVPYKKRFEKDEGKEKPLSTEPETNLSPVAEKKDSIAELTPEKYKCSTCNKGFPTHQALGGHRSSHNKLRVSIQNTVEDSPPENQSNCISQVLEVKEGSNPGFKLVENPRQCQICTKTFSSGQALGGHMRCHTTGPASQVASPEEDTLSVQKVLNFDLNELPDTEDVVGKNYRN